MKRLISALLLVAMLLSLSVPALAETEDPVSQGNETQKELSIYPNDEEEAPAGNAEQDEEDAEEQATPAAVPDYPEDDPIYRLNDGNVMTHTRFTLRQSVTVTFGGDTKGVYIAFTEAPESVQLAWLDASGTAVAEEEASNTRINQYFPVQEGAVSLLVSGTRAYTISDIKTYDAETAPAFLPIGEPVPDQCDLLVISAQTGNESDDFAGVLPYYTSQGYTCVQAYLSHKNRLAQDDAVYSLRASGVTAEPLFGGFNYRNYYDAKEKMVKSLWKTGELDKAIESWILACNPQVIVTQMEGGEGGEALRGLTADAVLRAVKELKKKVEVKKVYFHAADGESVTVLDLNSPSANLAGKTPAEVANTSYNLFTCNAIYHRTVTAQAGYALAYTTVGEDSAKDSFFENVPGDLLTNGGTPAVAATPEPTEAPPEDTPEPAADTPVPTQAPASAEPVASVETSEVIGAMTADVMSLAIRIAPLLIGLILMLLLCITRHPKIGLILLIVGFLASGALLFMQYRTVKTELVAAAMVTPAPTQTPEPTPEPTPEAMEEQAAEADAPSEEEAIVPETATPVSAENAHPEWDTYFRSASDPEEVVVFDYDNGKYEYRTDDLSILIDRRQTELPLTYYVAHIRMRNVNAFRPGFGTDAETGSTKCAAWEMARRYKAVLLITGDDMVHMEQDLKGIILRNGRYYSADDNEATMALTPGMSMRIFRQGSTTVNHLFDIGVEDTYAFGPILVENGEVYKRAYKHRVRMDNPRVGVGMIEPGHFVAIVVDGRLKGVSLGMPIMEFAELFKTEGCVQAFNMDGGASAAMVFMGEFINMRNTEHVRTMPDGLMWGYSEQVPSLSDPLVYTGETEN